jgi:hypothetical protein
MEDRPLHPLSEEEFCQACDEMQLLWKAWQDRFDITDHQAASLLLLMGTSLLQQSGAPLDYVLDYAKQTYLTSVNEDDQS